MLAGLASPWMACTHAQHPAAGAAHAPAAAPVPFERAWEDAVEAADRPSLAASPTTLFLAGSADAFVARSVADGKVVWSKQLTPQTGPVVSEGLVFVVVDGSLHALDAASGSDRWPLGIAGGPVQPAAHRTWVVVPSGTGLGAFRAADGAAIWQRTLGAAVIVPAVIDGGRVFVALSDGRLIGLDLNTGDTIWTAWLVSAPSGLTAGNGFLYFGTADGKLSAYTQDRGLYKWAYALGSQPIETPVADGKRVYVASRDHSLWALDARVGNVRWHTTVTARPTASPWLDGPSLVVALVTGEIDVVDAKTGKVSSTLAAPAPATAGLVDFPARLQTVAAPDRGWIVRLTLDPDQRKSTLVAFTRAKPPVK